MKNAVNESKADRAIRIILGILFLYFGFAISPWFYIAIGLITGITGFCGLYKLLKIGTKK